MIALLRKTLRLGMLGGIGYGVWKTVRGRRAPDSWDADSWVSTAPQGTTTTPAAAPVQAPAPAPTAAEAAASDLAASDLAASDLGTARSVPGRPPKPSGGTGPGRKGAAATKSDAPPGERLWVAANEGVCPPTHPVKAKLSSRIFHVPGGRNYSRTQADRCYPDEASAQRDGLRPAKR